jgi:hypothetical protein
MKGIQEEFGEMRIELWSDANPINHKPYHLNPMFCWVCVIFFARVVVFERMRWVRRGPGAAPPKKKILPRET